jgi:DNA-directed RNA polymerase subunit omega
MAQEGFDTLMNLTESRYRLSMVTARRAAQLKLGIPSVLPKDELPRTRNTVTIAMKELETGAGVRWGDELPSTDDLRNLIERERREEPSSYSVSRRPLDDDED